AARYVAGWLRMFFSSSTMRMLAILAPWQLQREATSVTHLAVEVDAATMCLDDIAHNRKAEAGRADVAAGGKLGEAFENTLALLRRNTGAGVAHGDQHCVRPRRGFDVHLSAGGRVAQRVGNRIGDRRGELGRIAEDGQADTGQLGVDLDLLFLGLRDENPQGLLDEVRQVDVLAFEGDVGGADARQVEEPPG